MASNVTEVSSKEQFDNLVKASRIVVVNFTSSSSQLSEQVSALYEALSGSLARPKAVSFISVDGDSNSDLSKQYSITAYPTFLIFRDGQLKENVSGANPNELGTIIEKLATHVRALGDSTGGAGSAGGSAGADWKGADLPRGYSDITDQVEIKGCELLNADEDAGPVKVLFETSKPSGLSGKSATKDYVQSGADDQLLLYIPFQGIIKLHTLQITSAPESDQTDVSRPGVVHLYINHPHNIDFGEADDIEPVQAITLGPDDWNSNGTANISLRFVKFQKTSSLIVYIQQGDGEADAVRLDRIRLIGEAGAKRQMGALQKVGDEE